MTDGSAAMVGAGYITVQVVPNFFTHTVNLHEVYMCVRVICVCEVYARKYDMSHDMDYRRWIYRSQK